MPQLSLYLDDATMDLLRIAAERDHVSLSKYASTLIRNHENSLWPSGFWDVYGALKDPTFAEEVSRSNVPGHHNGTHR